MAVELVREHTNCQCVASAAPDLRLPSHLKLVLIAPILEGWPQGRIQRGLRDHPFEMITSKIFSSIYAYLCSWIFSSPEAFCETQKVPKVVFSWGGGALSRTLPTALTALTQVPSPGVDTPPYSPVHYPQ